jgi:hypothetical protein
MPLLGLNFVYQNLPKDAKKYQKIGKNGKKLAIP